MGTFNGTLVARGGGGKKNNKTSRELPAGGNIMEMNGFPRVLGSASPTS